MQTIPKGLAILFFSVVLAFSFTQEEPETNITPNTEVWICVSEGAYAYHFKKDCRGLSNCKHEIKKMTLQEAFKLGKKKLCGWED